MMLPTGNYTYTITAGSPLVWVHLSGGAHIGWVDSACNFIPAATEETVNEMIKQVLARKPMTDPE